METNQLEENNMKNTTITLALFLSACAGDIEPTDNDDTVPSPPSDTTPPTVVEDVGRVGVILPPPLDGEEFIPVNGGVCEELPYEWPWSNNWQACIDIESNSRPWVCPTDVGPPPEPNCFPHWENEWDYNQEETWCCCLLGCG